MHYAISLKIPTVTQLRTIYPAPICFPEEAITAALHITFSTGLIRQQALCWHGGFPLWPRINTIPYCFEAPALTRQTALRARTGQQEGSGLKFVTEKTSYYRPMGASGCKRWDSSPATSCPVLFHLSLSTFNPNAVVSVNKALPALSNHFYALNGYKSGRNWELPVPIWPKSNIKSAILIELSC